MAADSRDANIFNSLRLTGAVLAAALFGATVLVALAPLLKKPKLVRAQHTHVEGVSAGKMLVAQRKLRDPNFIETVVLLLHYSEDGAMGLVVNRQTKISLSELFPDVKAKKPLSDPVYAGGPVQRTAGMALLRSSTEPSDSRHLFANVYLITDKKLLEKSLAAGKASSTFRVYLGYCGWAPDQLEGEIEAGAWHVFPGDAGQVFDPEPDALWERLIRKTELQIAVFSPGNPLLRCFRVLPTFRPDPD
jgi:putative transcriptional regulator